MKKMFLISLAALACITTACSDDDDNRCTAGFTKCDRDVLLTCSADGRIQKTQCPTTCSEVAGVAACDSLPGQGCGDVDNVGKCVGNTVYYCENNQLMTQDCGDDKVCGLDEDNLYACVNKQVGPGPGPGPHQEGCGDVDEKGKCDGNKALVCVKGKLETKECAANETCGPRNDGQVDCLNNGDNPIPCGDIDGIGKCEDNKVIYCDEEKGLVTETCGENQKCDKDAEGNYNCIDNPGYMNCGDVDAVGKCEGNVLSYCDEKDGLITQTCGKNEKCDKNAEGNFDCIDKDYKDCGDINAIGKCEGNVVSYCDKKKGLVSETCNKNQKCDKDADGYYNCIDREPGPIPCGDIDEIGKCDGNVLSYCDEQEGLITQTCESDETCKKVSDGYYDCVLKNQKCGDIDEVGVCKENAVYWCEDNVLNRIICPDTHICTQDPTNDFVYNCLEKVPCGDIDGVGVCKKNVLSYCSKDDNILISYDCGEGYTCGMNTEENFYDCLENEDPDACGEVNKKGSCKDGKAVYCGDDNKLHTDTCSKDQECKADDSGNFRCVAKAPADPCKGVDAKGKCDGNKAIYCDANELKTVECSKDQECKADDSGNFRCVDKAPADPCKGIDAKGKCDGNKAIYCDANELKTDECTETQECKADASGNFRCADIASIDPCEKCTAGQKCEKDEHGVYQCIDPTE